MILILEKDTDLLAIEQLQSRLQFMGFETVLANDEGRITLALIKGVDQNTRPEHFASLPGVQQVMPFSRKFKLVGKDFKHDDTVITIKGKQIGGERFAIFAGPCAIESAEQMQQVAESVSAMGVTGLRGGAFKPRTSPYDFQGLGEEGLRIMRDAADRYDLLCATEVISSEDVPLVAEYVDILQIGARNMQNFHLLKRAGQSMRPVLLKRGLCATYNEFLLAAEYIMSQGNPNVILCERGIRTFETYSRNTLDIAAVPILKQLTHLPIITDPSHGTGLRDIVAPMARASIAVAADGIIVECHPEPDKSVSDASQTLSLEQTKDLIDSLKPLGEVVGKRI